MSMNRKDLAKRIDQAIADSGKSNEEVVGGIPGLKSAEAVRLWRKGKTVPTLEHLQALAKIVKASDDYLLVGYTRDDMPAHKEFAPRHIDLLRQYKNLPKELRSPIRQMIEVLTTAGNAHYHEGFKKKLARVAEQKPPKYRRRKS